MPTLPVSPSTTSLPPSILKSSPASLPSAIVHPSTGASAKVPSSVIVLSVITVPPIVKSVVASIVVPVIARAVSAPSIPSTLVPIKSVAVIDVAADTVPKFAMVLPAFVQFPFILERFKVVVSVLPNEPVEVDEPLICPLVNILVALPLTDNEPVK